MCGEKKLISFEGYWNINGRLRCGTLTQQNDKTFSDSMLYHGTHVPQYFRVVGLYHRTTPVSYTHLDVYKRQPMHFIISVYSNSASLLDRILQRGLSGYNWKCGFQF